MSHSVIFENVTKKYKMFNKTSERILDLFFPNRYGDDFYALQNINFTAEEGDVIGIVGVNGSGKSTLSNLITGIVPQTSGDIDIKGQASLIAISAGLDNQLTGRDNIVLKCLMLGYNKKEIEQLMPDIIEFADIGHFIDQPVKKYSSGMKSRLGFAISVNIDPDVLVIDEALSVGDQTFTEKCLDKMNEFKEQGKTIFFVSHSIGQVKKFCQKILWLEAGEVKAYGTVKEIMPQYEKFLKEFKALSKEEQKNFKQHILEKRSKLRNQDNNSNGSVREDEQVPYGATRTKRNRRSYGRVLKFLALFLLIGALVAVGVVYVSKTGLLDRTPKTEDVQGNVSPTEKVVKTIKNEGNIATRSATLYKDPDMTQELETVTFSTPIYVLEQMEGVYKASYQDETVYVKADDVIFIDRQATEVDIRALDLYPILPEALQSSYEFFLAHVGLDYDSIKGKLRGLTEETEVQGLPILTYGNYDVTFRFNEERIADTMIVENIGHDKVFLDELRSNAIMQSNNGQLFTLSIEDYNVFIDLDEQIIELNRINE